MPNRLDALASVNFRPEERPAVNTGDINLSIEPTTKDFIHSIQNIGVAEEALNIGDVSAVGLVIIINRDKTNYVEIGLTGSYTVKLKPKDFCIFRPDGTLYALANTAALDVEYFVFPSE